MEYFRSPDGQIQADIAYRLGKIILQYESAHRSDKQSFESTLHLAILQNLLTNCVELQRSLTSNERHLSPLSQKADEKNIFGLSTAQITHNSFQDALTCNWMISQLRNAVSHPTALDMAAEFPSTGYSTVKNPFNSVINQYCFIASPDVKNNRPKTFRDMKEFDDYIRNHNLSAYNLQPLKYISGLRLSQNLKDPFARIFEIRFTTQELRQLTLSLCSYLSQPVQKDWDGVSYNANILAA